MHHIIWFDEKIRFFNKTKLKKDCIFHFFSSSAIFFQCWTTLLYFFDFSHRQIMRHKNMMRILWKLRKNNDSINKRQKFRLKAHLRCIDLLHILFYFPEFYPYRTQTSGNSSPNSFSQHWFFFFFLKYAIGG